MISGMTKKIGVSLRQELYDWAAREVEEGRAESVSALVAEGAALGAADEAYRKHEAGKVGHAGHAA